MFVHSMFNTCRKAWFATWRPRAHCESLPPGELTPGTPPPDFADLRQLAREVLDDCTGVDADRLRLRIRCASDARDLWLMRCDMYQVVAHQHLQSVASKRINGLLPAFEQWLPRNMIAPV